MDDDVVAFPEPQERAGQLAVDGQGVGCSFVDRDFPGAQVEVELGCGRVRCRRDRGEEEGAKPAHELQGDRDVHVRTIPPPRGIL